MEPQAIVVGTESPDPDARIAAAKAEAAGVEIEWLAGFARDAANFGLFDKIVSSLVFHQVPARGEEAPGLRRCSRRRGRAGGSFSTIADYAMQRSWLMRQAFKIVQSADGRTDTQPNADGFLERELARIPGEPLDASWGLDTPTGRISMFNATLASR